MFCPQDKSPLDDITEQSVEPQRSAVNKRSFSHQASTHPVSVQRHGAAAMPAAGPEQPRLAPWFAAGTGLVLPSVTFQEPKRRFSTPS